MALHNPTTLHQTYGLAKVIEDKLSSHRSRFNQSPRYFSNSTSSPLKPPLSTPTNSFTPHNNSTTAHTTTSGILPNPKPRTPLPFSRLSPEALQKRRADGLCFRCPEKYHPGHVCTPPKSFLLLVTNANQNRMLYRIRGNKEEVLVKWKHHDTSEATWEDWLEFMHRFSVFVGHEDMSVVQGETNDTPELIAAVQTKAAQDKARPTRIIKKPARYLE
nr:transposon Ty3-I Gag-Pol polyprotein [Tanacetum cinerariifolium]